MRKLLAVTMMCFVLTGSLTGCGAVKAVDTTLHCVPPMDGGCPMGQTRHHRRH